MIKINDEHTKIIDEKIIKAETKMDTQKEKNRIDNQDINEKEKENKNNLETKILIEKDTSNNIQDKVKQNINSRKNENINMK